jgi:deoxyribose-phosphate aldolase
VREVLGNRSGKTGQPNGLPAWLPPEEAAGRGLGRFLEYTLLRPDATRDEILRLCDEALAGGVTAVCVNGCWVSAAAERLKGSSVRVAAVVGFPLGAMATMAKFVETRLALTDGATEIDMVLAQGRAAADDWAGVEEEIATVTDGARGFAVKVILETAALTSERIVKACLVARASGARFVKTSTGFHPNGGATPEAVALMRRAVGLGMGVKASGGIKSAEDAAAMLLAGADRIGTSSIQAMRSVVGSEAPRLLEILRRGARKPALA